MLMKRYASGFVLMSCTLAAVTAYGQDAAENPAAFEPAVDTSAAAFEAEPAVDTSAALEEEALAGDSTAAETEEAAEDIRRRVTSSGVMDEMDLGTTEVTGNQELPKVLYIVPWQKTDPGEFMGKPINTILDEVLAPVNRDEFVRQVDYYRDLNGDP
jgi:hypothetical protein